MINLTSEQRDLIAQGDKIKRQVNREKRLARKEAARQYIKAIVAAKATGQRQPRELDKGFLAFIRRQPCGAAHLGGCSGPIEAAHIRYSSAAHGVTNPGMQRRNHDRHCNPLCRFHHQSDQHQRRERDFWADVGVDAYDNAARYYAAYLAGQDGLSGRALGREDGTVQLSWDETKNDISTPRTTRERA